ncbi:MAG: glycoside hydrolase family 3 protein [Bacteroidales bacterium]
MQEDKVENRLIYLDSTSDPSSRVEDLIQRMTLEEKIDLLAGYNDFYLHPCERLGIPAFKMADGPLGVSSWGLWGRATAFPSALSLAASWNKELAKKTGEIYSEEWRSRGIHFMLAPGANMYRASKGARNFEYFGEDPYLTSEMIVPFIKAVQNGGVIATVKHFVGNDQEFDRYTVSTELSKRALHEIYLPPFKAAIKEADVKAIMTGYNPVWGIYCTENKELIDVLKKDWGFKGMLMSDWACTYSADKAANHGLDLEMGSKSWFNRDVLLPLITKGDITEETINDKVRRIYGPCIEMGFFDRPQKIDTIPIYNPKANAMALEAAQEGIILLKNNGILPLRSPQKIAVIGPTANSPLINDRAFSTNEIVYGGGGSSRVHPWYVVNDLQGITNQFPQSKVLYSEGIPNRFKRNLFKKSAFRTKTGKPGLDAKYYAIPDQVSQDNMSSQVLQEQAKAAGRNVSNITTTQNVTSNKGDLKVETVDKYVNNEWWGAPMNNASIGQHYEVEWDGVIDVLRSDTIRIFIDAQGAFELWVDDQLVIDESASQSFVFQEYAFFAEKGVNKSIRLKYNNQKSQPSEIRMGYCYNSEIEQYIDDAKQIAKQADIVVFCAGLDGSIELEGRDRPFDLPFGQGRLIKELAQINPNLIVVMHAGGGVKMVDWIDDVSALLHAFYPGQEGGNALANILSGKVNPSAKLPFSIEKDWADSPAAGNYDETRREKKIFYNEGIFTGYRGYEYSNTKPLYSFGFGLSYSNFDYRDMKVSILNRKANSVEVSFNITNTSRIAGAEIAQLYVSDPKSKEVRPVKELKAFHKIYLEPNETKRIIMILNKEAFQYYSEKENQWIFEPGEFILQVGKSSDNIVLSEKIRM